MSTKAPRPQRAPKRQSAANTQTVFREFVRQLEKLDARRPQPAREASR